MSKTMRFLDKKSLSYMEYIRSYQTAYISFCRFTNISGWVLWTPLFTLTHLDNKLYFLFDPQNRFKSVSK